MRGCLPPSAFLEVLVASGMLVEVGRRIVAEACRQVVAWRGDGAGDAYDQFENDAHRRAIVGAIIQLAHVLGLDVVAEGVERPAQLDELRTLGCDFVQGFYLSPPLSSENIRRWIADGGRPVGTALLTP